MRDPNRIQAFCNRLAQAWRVNPDLRFGQLMWNAMHEFERDTHRDTFYVEDEEMIKYIEQYVMSNSPYYKHKED